MSTLSCAGDAKSWCLLSIQTCRCCSSARRDAGVSSRATPVFTKKAVSDFSKRTASTPGERQEMPPVRLRWPRRATARLRRLYWRAGNRAVGAEDATIARLGPQHGPATCARVKADACIGRHRFALPMPAGWTSQFALQKGLGHHCATPRPEHPYVGKARALSVETSGDPHCSI